MGVERAYKKRSESTKEERIAIAKNALALDKNNGERNTPQKQLSSTGYFAQENVKNFQTVVATHMFSDELKKKKGRGGFFTTVEDLRGELMEFIALCQSMETAPTIAALACFLGCDRNQLYDHARNPNSPFQADCKAMIDYCHMCLENGATENKLNSVAYIFQAKNYFDMKDTQDVQLSAKTSEDMNNPETLNALQKQINEESKDIKLLEAKEKN